MFPEWSKQLPVAAALAAVVIYVIHAETAEISAKVDSVAAAVAATTAKADEVPRIAWRLDQVEREIQELSNQMATIEGKTQ